jgi:hypothetical protein
VNTTHSGHRADGGNKLESRTIDATLIGYASDAGNYILIDDHGVQFESRNVEFDEGVPHRTLDVGERLWEMDDASVDMHCVQRARGQRLCLLGEAEVGRPRGRQTLPTCAYLC